MASSSAQKHTIDIENRTIIRVLLISLAFILVMWLIVALHRALFLIAIAFFLAVALNPPVSFLARKLPHRSRGLATAIAYLIVLSLLFMLFYTLVPPLVSQINAFIRDLPHLIDGLATDTHPFARFARRYELVDTLKSYESQITGRLRGAGGPLLTVLRRASGSLLTVLPVLVLTFLMLVEGPTWIARVLRNMPAAQRKHREQLLRQMYRVFTSYLNGQLIIAMLAGLSSFVVLRILGIPSAGPLAVIIGLFDLIPLIGASIGATLVIVAALFHSLTAAIVLLIFFIAYQQVENNVFQPIVQSKTVKLSPLLILLAVITGATLGGILGALVAIPTAGSLRVLAVDYMSRHRGEIL